jgi:hypothetical protein
VPTTLHPSINKSLHKISSTSGCRSVGIVPSRNTGHGVCLFFLFECNGTDLPENVAKLVNAATHGRGALDFPRRRCRTTLAYVCPGVSHWKPTRPFISRREHLHMATPVTGPNSVPSLYDSSWITVPRMVECVYEYEE